MLGGQDPPLSFQFGQINIALKSFIQSSDLKIRESELNQGTNGKLRKNDEDAGKNYE